MSRLLVPPVLLPRVVRSPYCLWAPRQGIANHQVGLKCGGEARPWRILLESTVSNMRTRMVVPAGTVTIFFCGAGDGFGGDAAELENTVMIPDSTQAAKTLYLRMISLIFPRLRSPQAATPNQFVDR